MYFLVLQVDLQNPWLGLVSKMAVGAVVFGALALVLDGEARRLLRQFGTRLRSQ
jgi:hypothetical protein